MFLGNPADQYIMLAYIFLPVANAIIIGHLPYHPTMEGPTLPWREGRVRSSMRRGGGESGHWSKTRRRGGQKVVSCSPAGS